MQAGWCEGGQLTATAAAAVPACLLLAVSTACKPSATCDSPPQDEGVAFLLTESQLVDERMLVLVNDLLASGEVPGGRGAAAEVA